MAYRGARADEQAGIRHRCSPASLAFLMNRQRDATGLIAFDERIAFRLPASARPGHLHALLLALERIAAGRALRRRRARCTSSPRRWSSAAWSCSSPICSTIPSRSSRGCGTCKFRGTDVIVFQLLDPHELTFPFTGAARFTDVESADEVTADPATRARRRTCASSQA